MKKEVYEAKKALLGSSHRERVFRRINDDKFMSDVLSLDVKEFKQHIREISDSADDGSARPAIELIYENFSNAITAVDVVGVSDHERMRRLLISVAAIIVTKLTLDVDVDDIGLDNEDYMGDFIAIIFALRCIRDEVYAPKGKNFSKPDSPDNGDNKDENNSDDKKQKSSDNDDDNKPKGILGKWIKIAEKYQSVAPGSAEEAEADQKEKECLNDIVLQVSTYDNKSKFDTMSKKEIWNFAAWAAEQIFRITDDVKHVANGKNDMSQLCSLLKIMHDEKKKKEDEQNKKKERKKNEPGAKFWEVIKNAPAKEADFISAINKYIDGLPKNDVAFRNRTRGYRAWLGKWLFARMNAKDKFIEQIINRETDELRQVVAVIDYKEDRDKPKYSDKLFEEYWNKIKSVPSDNLVINAMAHIALLHEIA